LGDDLIESFPCFIVSENLKNKIDLETMSGFEFDEVKITKSDNFSDLYGNKILPRFYWLKITGRAGKQDFGLADDFRLVVSAKALSVIKKTNIRLHV